MLVLESDTPLIKTLRDEQLAFRKAGLREAATSIGTVIGEATKESKEPDNNRVRSTIRKFIKALEETIAIAGSRGVDTTAYENELRLLQTFVPQTFNAEQLRLLLADTAARFDISLEMRNIKMLKEALDNDFPGQIDGKLLAQIIKES